MAARVAVVGVFHETNVFSPLPTQWQAFRRRYRGAELLEAFSGTRTVVGGFADEAGRLGWEVAPVFGAYATPAGAVTAEARKALQAALQEELDRQGEVDGVLLELHGAMVAEDTPDPEALVLDQVRRRWPDPPMACVLDLHANVRLRRLEAADIVTGYRTNPHVDTHERGVAAVGQLRAMLEGGSRPYHAHRGVPVIAPPVSQRTDAAPMSDLLEMAGRLESAHRLLDVTVHGGYAYGDVPHVGMGFSAYARPEGAADAEHVVEELARAAWENRSDFQRPLLDPAAAFERATRTPGVVAVADTGDNINGGAPGDGTWLLHHALRTPGTRTLATICDASALAEMATVGVGSPVEVRLGGRTSPLSGVPLDVLVTLTWRGDGTFVNSGPMATGTTVSMGSAAVVRCGDVDLVVQEQAVQPNDPELFRSLGLVPEEYDVVLLKGAAAVRAGWRDVAATFVDAATPGVTDSDLSRLTFQHAPPDLFRARPTPDMTG